MKQEMEIIFQSDPVFLVALREVGVVIQVNTAVLVTRTNPISRFAEK